MQLAPKGLLNKPFAHYDELSYVFGKDLATRTHVEMFVDIRSNVLGPNNSVPAEEGLEIEFLTICNPRMNMSLNDMMADRSNWSNNTRPSSNDQKRKYNMQ